MTMELEEFETDSLVAYLSRQTGLPDAHHKRQFRAIPGGFEYRLVVAYTPRSGLVGLLDRSMVRRAIKQALLQTHQNLDAIFRQFVPNSNPKFSTRGD